MTLEQELKTYKEFLRQYIHSQDEQALYQAEQIIKQLIQHNTSPEEIINIHIQAMEQLYPNLTNEIKNSFNFLLEAMISYGLAYQEYQVLREKQVEIKSEIEVAANMQQTLLSTKKPTIKGVDIGVISVPAKQMNGDYYHFIDDQQDHLGVAIADVVGKGVPAALCMSMIKYSLDSFPHDRIEPTLILKNLNRVVEKDVDPSMFITMLFGLYNLNEHVFTYASAGHEPGFYYESNTQTFHTMDGNGLVLGVDSKVSYASFTQKVEKGDMLILLTDGVTECRKGDQFIERDEIIQVLEQYKSLPAQEMVEEVFRHFERIQDFELRDDFTMIVLRRGTN
ncbi:PP2C family protein-serine/threonine phosphatase [Bacillaceae bacterium S4-13-58]